MPLTQTNLMLVSPIDCAALQWGSGVHVLLFSIQEDPTLITDIRADLQEECGKFGTVKKILMFDVCDVDWPICIDGGDH